MSVPLNREDGKQAPCHACEHWSGAPNNSAGDRQGHCKEWEIVVEPDNTCASYELAHNIENRLRERYRAPYRADLYAKRKALRLRKARG